MPANIVGVPSVTVAYGGELGTYEVEPGVTLKLRAEEAADLYPAAKQLDATASTATKAAPKTKARKASTVKNKARTTAKSK